jgi:hypothetical protein
LGIAAVCVAASVGFYATAWWIPDPDVQMLRDLPVLEDLDEMRQVDSVEFLKQMQKEGLFAKERNDDA